MEEQQQPMPGVSLRTTPRGITVFTLDYWADPERQDPSWANKMRLAMGTKAFKREFERDWTTSAGDSYYPEWSELPWERKVVKAHALTTGPIVRGWDFGIRHPACIWMQYAPAMRRLWVLRELNPVEIGTAGFRDLVLYLSGQLPREALLKWPAALRNLRNIEGDRRFPPTPWFSNEGRGTPMQFLDFAGHEANQRNRLAEKDSEVVTDATVLAEGGIQLQTYSQPVTAKGNILRPLMRLYKDGYSGLLVDPACPLLLDGLEGGIAYPKPTAEKPMPEEPKKDGIFEHGHDALGYAAVNIIPLVQDPAIERRAGHWEGRTWVWDPDGGRQEVVGGYTGGDW